MKIADYYKHLNNMAAAVQQSLQLNEIVDAIIQEVMTALEVPAAEIFLFEKTNQLLTIKAQRGLLFCGKVKDWEEELPRKRSPCLSRNLIRIRVFRQRLSGRKIWFPMRVFRL